MSLQVGNIDCQSSGCHVQHQVTPQLGSYHSCSCLEIEGGASIQKSGVPTIEPHQLHTLHTGRSNIVELSIFYVLMISMLVAQSSREME